MAGELKTTISTIATAMFLMASSAHAQLWDPNKGCFVDQNNQCAAQVQGPYGRPYQQVVPSPGAPAQLVPQDQPATTQPDPQPLTCSQNCRAEQTKCIQQGYQPGNDWYANFSRCGTQHTLCMQQCGQQ